MVVTGHVDGRHGAVVGDDDLHQQLGKVWRLSAWSTRRGWSGCGPGCRSTRAEGVHSAPPAAPTPTNCCREPSSRDDSGEAQVETRPLVHGLREEVVILYLPRVVQSGGVAPE